MLSSKRHGVHLNTTSLSTLSVDREEGVIRGVPVITAGVTKPPGSGGPSFFVDAVTLQQVADAINASDRGVISRMTHAELEGIDPIRVLVGRWKDATVVDGRVLATFVIGKYAAHGPSGNVGEYLMALAEEQPEAAGVSIYADESWLDADERVETGMVLRVAHLKAIDWVGEPAANPTGMLSAAHTEPSGATDGSGLNAAEPQGITVEYTPEQIAYLRSLGLADGATPEQIAEFVASLTPEQVAGIETAAAAKSPTPPAAAAQSTPAAPAVAAASARPATDRVLLSEINDIAQLAGLGGDWAVEMFLGGKTAAEARTIALQKKAAGYKPVALGGSGANVRVGEDRNLSSLNQAVQDAIMLRANHRSFYEFEGGRLGRIGRVSLSADNSPKTRKAHDRSSDFRGHSIIEMGRRYFVALGCREVDSFTRPEMATFLMSRGHIQTVLSRAGVTFLSHATGDFPHILADTMGKVLRQAYDTASPTWPLWARKTTAPDFKDIKKLQLSEAPSLVSMEEGEEYEYGSLTESRETYALGKYGKGVKFTREMLINDDLDAFSRVPMLMGRAASRLEETTAIGILTTNAAMSDSNALFSTAHANLTTGALTAASLGVARSAMRKQTPLGGDASNPLELTPKVLLVPEEISATAEQLVGSTVDPAKQNATPNLAFVQRLVVASSARLSITSTTQWYLFADYNEIDTVDVAFLEGEEGPTIEEEDEFDTDARRVKVRHHVAAKAIDWRGMVRSSGA